MRESPNGRRTPRDAQRDKMSGEDGLSWEFEDVLLSLTGNGQARFTEPQRQVDSKPFKTSVTNSKPVRVQQLLRIGSTQAASAGSSRHNTTHAS
jgi:hypothetical protein